VKISTLSSRRLDRLKGRGPALVAGFVGAGVGSILRATGADDQIWPLVGLTCVAIVALVLRAIVKRPDS